MNVMPHPLLQNIANEERRNMSKYDFDGVTGSNASRTPFEIHFKAFESHLRNGAMAHEFSRIRSNAMAVAAVKGLDDTIRRGWREVNTEKLAERVHAELEGTLFRPLAIQCRQLEKAAPELKDAVQGMEDSTRKLRAFHFKGILAAMFLSCLIIMGGCFAYGWWKLSRHYDQMRDAALERILLVNKRNEEAFAQLTKLNAPIRVVPTTDSRKRVIPGKFALVMEHAEDVGIEDTPDGKRVAIYFEKSSY